LVGDQIERHEVLACRPKRIAAQVQALRDGGGGVVAQALSVGHGDQEQVQGCAVCVAAVNEMALHQGLVNPTELFWHQANSLRAQHMFDGLHCGSG
jgi:hypothetical protein